MKTRNWRLAGAMMTMILAAGGLTACGSGSTSSASNTSGGLSDVTVMAFPGQSYRLPFLVADQEGFFKNHGISFKFVDQPNNLTGTQGMAATKAQVGVLSTTTQVQGAQAGQTYPFFCGGINVLQTTLIANTGSTLPSMSDGASWQQVLQALKGKKIGIQTPVGSGLQILFAAALKEAGLGPNDVTYVNLGGTPTTVEAALKNGSVDVAQVNPPGTQLLQTQKFGKPLIYLPDGPSVYKDYYGSGLVADPNWLKDNASTAKQFCDAYTEGLNWLKKPANANQAATILSKDSGVPQDASKLVVTDTFSDFSIGLNNATMQKTFDAYVNLGIAKPSPKPTTATLVANQ